jgi:hypothetical protein
VSPDVLGLGATGGRHTDPIIERHANHVVPWWTTS